MDIKRRVSLKPFNTLGFDVEARFFVRVDSIQALREAAAYARQASLPVLVLGGGSNIVLTKNYEGLVIYMGLQGKVLDEAGRLDAQAGENWHQLVQWSLQNQAYGLENLSLIPGNIGAAPIQNIGAYGVELKDVFVGLKAMDLKTGDIQQFSASDCQFAYRESIFKGELKGQYAITEVSLQLSKKEVLKTEYGALRQLLDKREEEPSAKLLSEIVCEIRSSKLPDPLVIGNAGSFFKNPVVSAEQVDALLKKYPLMPVYHVSDQEKKLAAGWLVEQAGFKGYRDGGVGVHDKQALVLVNHGEGTGGELLGLAGEIQRVVTEKFSIQLEIEPRIY